METLNDKFLADIVVAFSKLSAEEREKVTEEIWDSKCSMAIKETVERVYELFLSYPFY